MIAPTLDGRCLGCYRDDTATVVCVDCAAALARAGEHSGTCACVDCTIFDRLEEIRTQLNDAWEALYR